MWDRLELLSAIETRLMLRSERNIEIRNSKPYTFLKCVTIQTEDNQPYCILKQWIALRARSDWLYPLLFPSERLRKNWRPGLHPWQVKKSSKLFFFCGVYMYYLTVIVYFKTKLFTYVSVASGGYLPRRFAAGSVSIHREPPPLRWIVVTRVLLTIVGSGYYPRTPSVGLYNPREIRSAEVYL